MRVLIDEQYEPVPVTRVYLPRSRAIWEVKGSFYYIPWKMHNNDQMVFRVDFISRYSATSLWRNGSFCSLRI